MPKRIVVTVPEVGMPSIDCGALQLAEVEMILASALTTIRHTLLVAALKSALTSGVVLAGSLPKGPPA